MRIISRRQLRDLGWQATSFSVHCSGSSCINSVNLDWSTLWHGAGAWMLPGTCPPSRQLRLQNSPRRPFHGGRPQPGLAHEGPSWSRQLLVQWPPGRPSQENPGQPGCTHRADISSGEAHTLTQQDGGGTYAEVCERTGIAAQGQRQGSFTEQVMLSTQIHAFLSAACESQGFLQGAGITSTTCELHR